MSPRINNEDSKSESDEFDEEDSAAEAAGAAEELDVDHIIRGLDSLKRRGQKIPDPAWRRLERYMEEKRTDELLSDFDDYDIGDGAEDGEPPKKKKKKKAPK